MTTVSSRKSVFMMTNTGREFNKVGEPIRADGYYGSTDGLHTVQIVYSNFVGRFGLQGTLATEPTESDWFDINLNYRAYTNSDNPKVQFPVNPLAPTGGPDSVGDTGTQAFSFIGNFVWLRAILDRSYLPEPVPTNQNWQLGQIDKVLLSL